MHATASGMLGNDPVMSVRDGFCFATELLPSGPGVPLQFDPLTAGGTDSLTYDQRSVSPLRRTVYVAVPGAHARTSRHRLIVEDPEQVPLLDVPVGHVARIVLFGNVGLSGGLRTWYLEQHIDVIFCSYRGRYLGHLCGTASRPDSVHAQLRLSQDPLVGLPIAWAVGEAKIKKQVVLVKRFAQGRDAAELAGTISAMYASFEAVSAAAARDELMGLEGAAARSYFAAYARLLPPSLPFVGRSRRPPRDLVNAALSYGYSILLGEAVAALHAAGLDPSFGVLHAVHRDRPGLALDLIEEFRPLVVDQCVLLAARRGDLRPEHADPSATDEGVYLNADGRRVVSNAYEHRMLQISGTALPGTVASLRRLLHRQAERLARSIADPALPWTGLAWR